MEPTHSPKRVIKGLEDKLIVYEELLPEVIRVCELRSKLDLAPQFCAQALTEVEGKWWCEVIPGGTWITRTGKAVDAWKVCATPPLTAYQKIRNIIDFSLRETQSILKEYQISEKRYGEDLAWINMGRALAGPGSLAALARLVSLCVVWVYDEAEGNVERSNTYLSAINDLSTLYRADRYASDGIESRVAHVVRKLVVEYGTAAGVVFSSELTDRVNLEGHDPNCSRWIYCQVALRIAYAFLGERTNLLKTLNQLFLARGGRRGTKILLMDRKLTFEYERAVLPFYYFHDSGEVSLITTEGEHVAIEESVRSESSSYLKFCVRRTKVGPGHKVRNMLADYPSWDVTLHFRDLECLGLLHEGHEPWLESHRRGKDVGRIGSDNSYAVLLYSKIIDAGSSPQWRWVFEHCISVGGINCMFRRGLSSREVLRRCASQFIGSLGWTNTKVVTPNGKKKLVVQANISTSQRAGKYPQEYSIITDDGDGGYRVMSSARALQEWIPGAPDRVRRIFTGLYLIQKYYRGISFSAIRWLDLDFPTTPYYERYLTLSFEDLAVSDVVRSPHVVECSKSPRSKEEDDSDSYQAAQNLVLAGGGASIMSR
ncbi:hypothetical protein [Bacillus mycoides]|uniref:hypothetical protein n=1 Tax=Bacillus mycoides TaxID=1405 RepID=UPI003D658444